MKPAGRALSVIDYHTEGEPMRIVVGGAEPIPGATLMERSEHLAAHGRDLLGSRDPDICLRADQTVRSDYHSRSPSNERPIPTDPLFWRIGPGSPAWRPCTAFPALEV